MSRAQELLHTIAGEFHIERGEQESAERWKARVIYSLLGRMAYASLSDHAEEDDSLSANESISITHLKRRVQVLMESYLELYPEIQTIFLAGPRDLSDEIYDIYLKTGCIYKAPFEIFRAVPCAAEQSELRFVRGMPLDFRQYVSGLGAYLPQGEAFEGEIACASVREMFGLMGSTLTNFWADLVSRADWRPLHEDEDMEYLSHVGSWQRMKNPGKDGGISLARIGQQGGFLYYLCQTNDGRQHGSQLPQWLVNDAFYGGISYFAVANACFAAHSCLPAIRYKMDGPIVQVRLEYPLPPAEQYWFKLYSWPLSFSQFSNIYSRIFSLDVFREVRAVLEETGYRFAEE